MAPVVDRNRLANFCDRILYFTLALVHFKEGKSGGGSLFARKKGYVRLEQRSLNAYEVHDAEEFEDDEEAPGLHKP